MSALTSVFTNRSRATRVLMVDPSCLSRWLHGHNTLKATMLCLIAEAYNDSSLTVQQAADFFAISRATKSGHFRLVAELLERSDLDDQDRGFLGPRALDALRESKLSKEAKAELKQRIASQYTPKAPPIGERIAA